MSDLLTEPTETTVVDRAALYAARREAENRRLLAQFSEEELAALEGLYATAKRLWDTGGGGTCARVLLGCYNGTRFPFDLTDLRRLDDSNLSKVLTVLRMDARCRAEVHVILGHMLSDRMVQAQFERWAFDLGLKGRAKKADVQDMWLRALQRAAA